MSTINSSENHWPADSLLPTPVRMPHGDYEALYASKEKRSPDPIKVVVATTPNSFRGKDSNSTPQLDEYIAQNSEARALRDAAVSSGDAFDMADTLPEHIMTMMRASDEFGTVVVEATDLDAAAPAHTHEQLKDVLAVRIGLDPNKAHESVAPETFVLTALALATMRDRDPDEVERAAADRALNELAKHPADLEKMQHTPSIDPHLGELAVEAVLDDHRVLVAS